MDTTERQLPMGGTPATKDPLVQFEQLTKHYRSGQAPVLADVSFSVYEGDFIGLIGPSGCGKSTMLKLISGLTPVTDGHLWIDGKDPLSARAELAVVFQEATLLPWLTVRQNVELPLRLKGKASSDRKETAQRLLDLVRLSHVEDNYPRQLSGGMKMRSSIARALSLSPKIMLLDEPFGALDEMTRDKLNEDLLQMREEEKWTAFFVTHSVAEAVFLSNRIAVFSSNPGRIAHWIDVDFPYPRQPLLRDSLEFHNKVCEVSQLLRGAHQP